MTSAGKQYFERALASFPLRYTAGFNEGFDTLDLKEAKALADELSS
jgi:hypothetical protein